MRRIKTVYIILFLSTFIFKASGNLTTTVDFNEPKVLTSERQVLIDELKQLKNTLASNDKNKIAEIFMFPISDSIFQIFTADKGFYEKYKKNGKKITKSMFLEYFDIIYSENRINQMNVLFQKINIDSLLHKDFIESNTYNILEPCYYYYKIEIIKRTVTLTMNMNSNANYKSKKDPNKEMLENDSAVCEHDFWWTFKFDGSKLIIESITGAD